jgi:hypothetical protein
MHTATGDLFEYLFANPRLGRWMFYVFLIGIGVILWRNRRVAVLGLLLPLAVTAGAAMLRVYPYGGSRHDAFLTVFLAPAIAVALSFAARGKPAVVLLMMACLIPAWLKAEQLHALDDRPQVSKRDQMNRALSYLLHRTPRARVLVVDQLGSATLGYYLCHGHRDEWRAVGPDANTYRCGDYQVLTVEAWGAPLAAYREALRQARKTWPDLFPDPAWTFSISFTRDRDVKLVAVDFGLFGKIELWRIWPPP